MHTSSLWLYLAGGFFVYFWGGGFQRFTTSLSAVFTLCTGFLYRQEYQLTTVNFDGTEAASTPL